MKRLVVVVAVAVAAGASLGAAGAVIGAYTDAPNLAARWAGTASGAVIAYHLLGRIPGSLRARAHRPDAFEAFMRSGGRAARSPEPPERDRLQGLVRLSVGAAGGAHDRLRPMLRELADARLDAVFGTHLDRDPRAAERLGPAAWAWVRPDRRQPADRLDPGPGVPELDAVIGGIERLGANGDGEPAPSWREGRGATGREETKE